MIVELTLITSPLRKYLQVNREQLTDLDLQDEIPTFECDSKPTSIGGESWLFEWTDKLRSTVLKRIADFGGTARFSEEYLPRLHEASWQRTNNLKECV